MIIIDTKLQEREAAGNPIQVGIIGAGEMGIGLVNQIERYTPGMRVAAIFNRNIQRAKEAYTTGGVDSIIETDSPTSIENAIEKRQGAITANASAIIEAEGIDVIVEMTGTIHFAFDVIMQAFSAGKKVVSFNAELDATVGPYLQTEANRNGTLYTLGDGDQPGVTLNLYRRVKSMGFKPLVCGNIKGMLDHYRTPETQKGFAEANGLSVNMVTSFADGTKVSMEQACIANATNMQVAQRGMYSIESEKHVDELTGHYNVEEIDSLGGIVEMTIGAQPGPGVFVYASTDDPLSTRFLKYGKLGDGPLYSFYVPYHLLFFELPTSIARIVDFNDGTVDSNEKLKVEVVATAKRDLKAGQTIDGIGGFDTYGLCENRSVMSKENLLPMGLAEGKILTADIKKDAVISWDQTQSTSTTSIEASYFTL